MKTFNEIKSEYESKNYSVRDLKGSIFVFSLVRFLFTELFTFFVSTIPFLIGFGIITSHFGFSANVAIFYLVIHFLFYVFYVKRVYTKELSPSLDEVNMIIKSLKEIKKEKTQNKKTV